MSTVNTQLIRLHASGLARVEWIDFILNQPSTIIAHISLTTTPILILIYFQLQRALYLHAIWMNRVNVVVFHVKSIIVRRRCEFEWTLKFSISHPYRAWNIWFPSEQFSKLIRCPEEMLYCCCFCVRNDFDFPHLSFSPSSSFHHTK